MVSGWEQALFCSDSLDHRERRIMARKLFLVPNDQVMHHPLDLLGQGDHFATINSAAACRWVSTFATFAAFDFVVSHLFPDSVAPSRNLSPEEASYSAVPLPHDAVRVCICCFMLSAISRASSRISFCWKNGLPRSRMTVCRCHSR